MEFIMKVLILIILFSFTAQASISEDFWNLVDKIKTKLGLSTVEQAIVLPTIPHMKNNPTDLSIYKRKIDELYPANQKIKLCNANLPFGNNYLSWAFRRAKLNSKLGLYDQALEDFNFIFSKIKPTLLKQFAERSIYQSMAISYTYIEDYEKALIYNFKALDVEPNSQAVLNNMGWLLVKVKDYDLALKYLDKCHEINPKNYYAFFNKAILYLETGKYIKALNSIEKTIADERSHKLSKKAIPKEKTIWTTRGEIYYNLGRYHESIKDFQKAIQENPGNSHAYRCLALVYKATNQLDKACVALAKSKEYKFDVIYNTDEVNVLITENCMSK